MSGHISRFCEMKRDSTCSNYGRLGHTTRNCRIRRNYQNVRQIQEQWDSGEKYSYTDDTPCPSAPVTVEEEEDNVIQHTRINVLTVAEPIKIKEPKTKKMWIPCDQVDQTASTIPPIYLDLDDYIQGRRAERNIRFEEAETLITTGRFEKAKN